MTEFLLQYGWLLLGAILLALEVMLPGVFLVFFGISAIIVGLNVLVMGSTGFFGYGQQIIAFAVIAGVAVYLGRRWYGAFDDPAPAESINKPAERLHGRVLVVSTAIEHGRGRVAAGDTHWTAEGSDVGLGGKVRVTGSKGNVLVVEPVETPAAT